jgi:hypothetical protein
MTQEVEERPLVSPPHAPQMLEQAVGQAELAQFWAKHNRPDLVMVFTNMAKLMLLEGHGAGTECEFWVLAIRSCNACLLHEPDLALQCATRAHELAERIFSDEPQRYAVACGTLGKALALNGQAEEARKWLSKGIFGLSESSHKPPVGTPDKLKKYYSEAFIDYVLAIQQLPERPRTNRP